MKYAIRITDDGRNYKLFAVAKDESCINYLRYLARKSFPYGSSYRINISKWSPEFEDITYVV